MFTDKSAVTAHQWALMGLSGMMMGDVGGGKEPFLAAAVELGPEEGGGPRGRGIPRRSRKQARPLACG